jgi:3-hydroxybutyryl-CoA dehydratase
VTAVEGATTLAVGDALAGPTRVLTHERALWYGDGLMTSAAGERRLAMTNIHTDEEYARSQGLPGAIADGMHSTNWISSMLTEYFGRHYVERGRLRTKYIKPTFVGTELRVLGRVTERTELHDSVRYELEVWTEDDSGTRLTDGDATVEVRAPEQTG